MLYYCYTLKDGIGMKIVGLQKLTLLDFPGHVACTVFLGGCNFSCPFCYISSLLSDAQDNLINEDDFYAFLDKRKGKIDGVAITGGEPLLREDLFDIIELFKKNNVAIELTTNAMLINSDNARKLGELFNPLCDYVQVSLDGADEETHDKTR